MTAATEVHVYGLHLPESVSQEYIDTLRQLLLLAGCDEHCGKITVDLQPSPLEAFVRITHGRTEASRDFYWGPDWEEAGSLWMAVYRWIREVHAYERTTAV